MHCNGNAQANVQSPSPTRQSSSIPTHIMVVLQVNEGSALTSGALIATLDLDDPTKVKRAEGFTGELQE